MSFSRDQMRKVYEDTLAGVQRRYDELSANLTYVQRHKDPFIENRLLLLEDEILDLYTSIRALS